MTVARRFDSEPDTWANSQSPPGMGRTAQDTMSTTRPYSSYNSQTSISRAQSSSASFFDKDLDGVLADGPSSRRNTSAFERDYTHGHKLKHHPLGLVLFSLWAAFTLGLVVLLQKAAAAAGSAVHQPWHYSSLPGILLTVFAQGHVAVTTVYLGRLAVSALHLPGRSPCSWAELFWQADRNWQGPLGFLSTFFGVWRTRARLSSTFFLFAGTCLVATATPVLLSRAYELKTIDVAVRTRLGLNVFQPSQIQAIDAYLQVAAGGGAWTTAKSVLDVYNSSVYIPVGSVRDPSRADDIFFAGQTYGADVNLVGVRTQGGCDRIDQGEGQGQAADDYAFWKQACDRLPMAPTALGTSVATNWNANVNLSWCSSKASFSSWMDSPSSSFASALVWINATNGTDAVQGVVQCNVTWSTGRADLNGRNLTFDGFQEAAVYDVATAQGGEPLLHPLNAALTALGQQIYLCKFTPSAIINMLGYTATLGDQEVQFDQPTVDGIAQALWTGAAHMGSALGLLSQQGNRSYDVTQYVSVAGRTVSRPFAYISWALLGLWLVLLLLATALLYRPTIGDSLNAYVAARLLVDRPDLVDGRCCGPLEDNGERMRTRFEMVGDVRAEMDVGHVGVGGVGMLVRGREYAGAASAS